MIGKDDNYPIKIRRAVLPSKLHEMMIIAFKSNLDTQFIHNQAFSAKCVHISHVFVIHWH